MPVMITIEMHSCFHCYPENYDPAAAEVTEEMREKNAGIFSRLHTLLAGICKTIPM
jgi:hypothetical protein